MIRWRLYWTEPCNCHRDHRTYRTRNAALADIPRLSRPLTNIAGKVTKLVRHSFRVERIET